ncbi:hypothetical protein GCM10018793_61720 [Streptomyces sulfonofaciens]|uniref:Uncharacterized protein n=1 Tax=Streptomyces sulfonofaciens TaxID=68272 RepID=A0A919GM09_9ACTN|nr:hypothetical protein GCM10018793_61720 [Streptomyces sulfonofaciens]
MNELCADGTIASPESKGGDTVDEVRSERGADGIGAVSATPGHRKPADTAQRRRAVKTVPATTDAPRSASSKTQPTAPSQWRSLGRGSGTFGDSEEEVGRSGRKRRHPG